MWLAQGKFEPAIQEFTAVVGLDPKSAGALANLAGAYAAAGAFDRAAETVDAALRLSPPEPLASDLRARAERYRRRER